MKTEQIRLSIFLICMLFCTAGLFCQAPNWKRDFVFERGGIDTVRIEQPIPIRQRQIGPYLPLPK